MNTKLSPTKCSGFCCYGCYSSYATDMDLGLNNILAGQQKIRNSQNFKSNTVKVVVNKMAAHYKLAGGVVSVSTTNSLLFSWNLRPGSSTCFMFFDLIHACCWT